jgi:hypothetical protein
MNTYIVTEKTNPDALPFVGQFWTVKATSEREAIDKVASSFWEPLREQCKSELIAVKQ